MGAPLLTTAGGPHVTFGRGLPCPDEPTVQFLLGGDVASTGCPGSGIGYFDPLAPEMAQGFTEPIQGFISAEVELFYLPEYGAWDGVVPLNVGCPRGGTLNVTIDATGAEAVAFDGCAFTAGFALTGMAYVDGYANSFNFSGFVEGRWNGTVGFNRTEFSYMLNGQLDGVPVNVVVE